MLELCNRLRARGVDAFVDQFLPGAPSEGWPLWMERQIEQRDFTLMVCTEAYHRRFMGDDEALRNWAAGVVWEARILRNLLYEDAARHGRIVPVLFEPSDSAFVPTVFRGHFYDISGEHGFESLLRHLLREPGAEATPLGSQGSRWSAFERPWLVPAALRTTYFTGREGLLARIHVHLSERHRAALSGLGGVGKTQTAVEYALRHRADYPDGTFWINAETIGGLTSDFVAIAAALRLPAAGANDQEEAVKAVLTWFNGTDEWLLILDNVENRGEVRRFVPPAGSGDVLITSRESVFQELGIARALDVTDLDDGEAVHFLLLRTGRDDAESPERDAAAELAAELGNLPLALEQAAAYIVEAGTDFAAYVRAFRKRRVALLEKAIGLLARDTVAVTWAANFEAVEHSSAAAAEALRLTAFLAPDAIPFDLFLAGARNLGDAIADALDDPDELTMAEMLRPLVRYSLIRLDAAANALYVHRLVQEIVRTALTEAASHTHVERAALALDATFPDVEYANWARCERLVPHVVSIAGWIASHDLRSEAAGRVANATGQYLYDRGRYAESQALLERALSIRERTLGSEHIEVASSLHSLAVVLWYRGRYADAQPLNERALMIRERALGADHPDVASSLNMLGILHTHQGNYAEAQPLYERALAIRERALGPGHPHVAHSLSNLANNHREQGRYDESLPLLERALVMREKALGAEHPDVGASLDNLGENYVSLGRHAEAEALFERALLMRERALGSEHPDLVFSLNNLAGLRAHFRRYAEAEPLFERACALRERTLGPDHPSVAESVTGLASVYAHQGRHAEAEPLFERVMNILERSHAPIYTAQTLARLASIRRQQGRAADAIHLYERALALRERTFVADHPELVELRTAIDALRTETA